MLKGKMYCITPENLTGHEWIGLGVTVVRSTDPSREGISGKIIDETRNTMVLESGKGEKTLPKREVILEASLGKEKVQVEGRKLVARPEDRVKLFWRKRHGRS